MSAYSHKLYIATLALIVIATTFYLSYSGYAYYKTSLEERFYHTDHNQMKPSGIFGHGLGIIGSLCMIVGVVSYMARKRYRWMSRYGKLKHWLEFHIFLCTLGPVMVLFHTSFKFGGIVAVSFWSMVAVFVSGVIGRFIYIQIPRTIEGRELGLNEIREMKGDFGATLKTNYQLDDKSYQTLIESTQKKEVESPTNAFSGWFRHWKQDARILRNTKIVLKSNNLKRNEYQNILKLVKNEISLNQKIDRLVTMQNLFKYWHVAHLPFALVMLIIMVIHVVVTILFGYRWIF